MTKACKLDQAICSEVSKHTHKYTTIFSVFIACDDKIAFSFRGKYACRFRLNVEHERLIVAWVQCNACQCKTDIFRLNFGEFINIVLVFNFSIAG